MKKALHEIHRRSLWQVLGVYVMGSWMVLQVVDTLNNLLDLPEWAGYLAVLLLSILSAPRVDSSVSKRHA